MTLNQDLLLSEASLNYNDYNQVNGFFFSQVVFFS